MAELNPTTATKKKKKKKDWKIALDWLQSSSRRQIGSGRINLD